MLPIKFQLNRYEATIRPRTTYIPFLSSCINLKYCWSGRNIPTIFEPSSGGNGMRLKHPKNRFKTMTIKKTWMRKKLNIAKRLLLEVSTNSLTKIEKMVATIKLDIGPASAVSPVSLFIFLKLYGLIGTGLA